MAAVCAGNVSIQEIREGTIFSHISVLSHFSFSVLSVPLSTKHGDQHQHRDGTHKLPCLGWLVWVGFPSEEMRAMGRRGYFFPSLPPMKSLGLWAVSHR